MSNSNLVVYKKWSPNYESRRGNKITHIVIHHMAGVLSIETCGNIFARETAYASSHYGVGNDGRIGQYVDEAYRAWTTSNFDIDKKAVTIEVANSSTGGQWPVSDKALQATINLCVDICKRNGIKKLNYTGDKTGNLHMHKWYAATACPGPYLASKFEYIAEQVNKKLAAPKKTTKKTTATKTTKKYKTLTSSAITTYAKQVIQGKYGNGSTRVTKLKKALKADGYEGTAGQIEKIQKKVNTILSGSSTTAAKKYKVLSSSAITTYAKQVIRGTYGNGSTRVAALKAQLVKDGYEGTTAEVNKIQAKVNALLS